MDITILKEIPNKRGELKTKVVRITNKKPKKGIDFDTINDIYIGLLEKYKPESIIIIAKPHTGNFTTLKSRSDVATQLQYADDNYFDDKPKGLKEKLQGSYYSVDITINI